MSSGTVNAFAASKFNAGAGPCASAGMVAAMHATKSTSIKRFMVVSSASGCPQRRRRQDELLHAPRFDLAQDDLVGITTVHHVNHLEPGRDLARFPELADHRAIELRLVDLTRRLPRSRRVAVRVRIGMEDVLMRPRRDAQRPADPEVGDLPNRLQVVVEHLIAIVGAIGHPHVAALVHLKSVREVELTESLPGLLAPS